MHEELVIVTAGAMTAKANRDTQSESTAAGVRMEVDAGAPSDTMPEQLAAAAVAVTEAASGDGLTVIANALNPAGVGILQGAKVFAG